MFRQMRKSSRGNPWHDWRGRFCSGPEVQQLTKDGYISEDGEILDYKGLDSVMGAFAVKKGITGIEYCAQTKGVYGENTSDRFNAKATDDTKRLSEYISKKTGESMPTDGSEYSLRMFNEKHQYDTFGPVSEAQAKKAMYLGEETGIPYSKSGRFGGNVGAYISTCENYKKFRDPANWERRKRADGGVDYVCGNVGLIHSHNGVYDTTRISHPIRDGHRTVTESDVAVNRKNPKECMKALSNYEVNKYTRDYKQFSSKKRSPLTIQQRLEEHEALKGNWTDNGDGTYSCGDYTIEQSEHGWRCKRNVYFEQKVRDDVVGHERLEWVVSACSSPEEAKKAAIAHDKESILKNEINLKAAKEHEIKRWAKDPKKYGISSKNQYYHLLDDLKKEK